MALSMEVRLHCKFVGSYLQNYKCFSLSIAPQMYNSCRYLLAMLEKPPEIAQEVNRSFLVSSMYKLIMNASHLYVNNPASQSSYTDVFAVIVCSSCMYTLLDEKHFNSEKNSLEKFSNSKCPCCW